MMKNNNLKLQLPIFLFAIFIFSFLIFNFHLNSAFADITTGLVSHYKLDEASGTVAADSAGSKNGTLTNGPTWTTGKINNGLSFDGINDYVSFPSQASANAYTQSVWIYMRSSGGYIFANDAGAYWCNTASTAVWMTRITSGCASTRDDLSLPVITANQWTHLVFVYDGVQNIKRIYKNGVLSASKTPSHGAGSLALTGDANLIGDSNDGANFNGVIDDVRIYNRALTAQDVSDLYNLTATSSSSSSSLSSSSSGSFALPQNIGVETLCVPTSVNVFWTAPNAQVQSYNIENIGVWSPVNTTNTGYVDNAVAKDTYYIYDVTAVYGQGESAPASILVKTPSSQECETETGLTINCPYSSDEANYKYAMTFNSSLHKMNPAGLIIPTTMSAGGYKVSLASFDGGSVNRINQSQPNEQWYISLKNSSGNEIAKTASSTDLEDNVAYAYKQEVVNESLAVSDYVPNVQAMWGGGWYPSDWGSVYGICGYFEKIDPATGLPYGSSSEEVSIDSFTVIPNPIDGGSTTVLSWTSSNADYCSASGGWSGFKSLSGSTTTLPIYGATTFGLKCVSADRSSEASTSVTVNINSGENTITSVNCQPSPRIANIGQDITWTVVPVPTSGSYTYSWSGDDNLSGSSQTVTKSYSTTGTKTGIVDIGGATNPQQCTGTVRITASPSFDEF